MTMHVFQWPAVRLLTADPAAMAVTGTWFSVLELLPSSPWIFWPQQTTPPFTSAQVCAIPAATAVAPLPGPKPTTFTGAELWLIVPSPNCPRSLMPQHWTPPFTTAQECSCPTATAVTPLVG